MKFPDLLAGSVFLLAAGGCDPRQVLRPVELDLQGLSASVEVLRVAVDRPEPGCTGLTAPAALDREPFEQQTWTRGQTSERTLLLEPVPEMEVMIWAVGLDRESTPIQFGCDRFGFADVELPERTLVLRMQP